MRNFIRSQITMEKLLLFLLLMLSHQVFSQDLTDTIHWRPDYKLKWEDFRGMPEINTTYAATTYCSISYTYDISEKKLVFDIASFFYRNLSWTRDTFSTNGLAHEQGHFDINKLFALKLEIAFRNYQLNERTADADLKRIFDAIIIERDKFDERYDNATKYSFDKDKQREWSERINIEVTNAINKTKK